MRVWDRFLTERDKAYQEFLGERKRFGFGSKPALLMVDHLNYGFAAERKPFLAALRDKPLGFGEEGWEAVEHSLTLLTFCRALGVPVIHTALLPPGSPAGPAYAKGNNTAVASKESEEYDILSVLEPRAGETVLHKAGASAFAGTPLDAVLRQRGVDTLLVTGNSTSGCVRGTVVDAAYLRFRTIVVEDCVYDRTEASHAMSLFDMSQKYADVLSLAEVTDWLESRQPGREMAGTAQGS